MTDDDEFKDPAIKLFGTTIPVQDNQCQIMVDSVNKSDLKVHTPLIIFKKDKDQCRKTNKAEKIESPVENSCKIEKSVQDIGNVNNYQGSRNENEAMLKPKTEDGQGENSLSSRDKLHKKPDRILPCPRCNSQDTKFCYFNNYNVNQPRHFCKNCHRYWTAGGTVRNVPVGAGRRKKHLASQYRQLMMSSERIPANQVDSHETSNQKFPKGGVTAPSVPIKGNGKVLSFGQDGPLCDSIASGLHGEQKGDVELGLVVSEETEDKPFSCGSPLSTVINEEELLKNGNQKERGRIPDCFSLTSRPHPMPFCAGPTWAYPLNMAAGRCSSEIIDDAKNGNRTSTEWGSTVLVAGPALCTPSIPFVPASYWACMPSWAARAWNIPWIPNGSISPSSSTSNSDCSNYGSPTLGKHSRDANLEKEEKTEKCFWVPKTLRIDDPDDAAKVSIWETLGSKSEQNGPILKGGIFKAFNPKVERKEKV